MPAHYPEHASDTPYQAALHRLLSLVDLERMRGAVTPVHKYDLDRMRELAARLHLLDGGPPVVHVAGTKGKGSVAAMTASILREHGLRTGLYTSPHLHSFRERIRLNGEPPQRGLLRRCRRPHMASRRCHGERAPSARRRRSRPSPPWRWRSFARKEQTPWSWRSASADDWDADQRGRIERCSHHFHQPRPHRHPRIDGRGDRSREGRHRQGNATRGHSPSGPVRNGRDTRDAPRRKAAPLTTVGRDVTYVQEEHDLAGQTVSITTARDRYRVRLAPARRAPGRERGGRRPLRWSRGRCL